MKMTLHTTTTPTETLISALEQYRPTLGSSVITRGLSHFSSYFQVAVCWVSAVVIILAGGHPTCSWLGSGYSTMSARCQYNVSPMLAQCQSNVSQM